MSVKTALLDEFMDEVEELGKLEVGSEKYKVAVDGIKKIYDMMTEQDKMQLEQEIRQAEQESKKERQAEEDELKQKQLKEERRDKWLDIGLRIFEIGAPLAITVWGTIMVLDFEKDEIVGSFFSKSWLQKFANRK